MNRSLKIILIIFSFVLLSIFLSTAAIYYFIAKNPLNFSSLRLFILTNNYAQLYLFWVSVILAILTMITIFVILFYPKRIIKFTLKEEHKQINPQKKFLDEQTRRSDDSETEQRVK
ncbi:alkaline shock response membrane anchor protein AmaP [Enterococcus xiangfangensis]|uniref:alkaline shock response membrane anchor protein AmaP n=1 Tax=Enterococcus xiangfangensis TaxID=1296537 RepID=UPI0010F8D3A9|nr:alkaline shock response membrane anchor protein AmaP [Enterococcus xiangfangensis]MBM7710800.1 putative membrane protein [Enterococcus xiangfangensis]NBK08245.1 alkaline shock response membrane anchor protein AmaP [Enterococcus asini]